MPLSERLRRSRKKRGLTLKDVNRATGISVSFLSEIERGKTNPSIETIKKLAQFYEVPLKDLMPNENRTLPTPLEEAKKQFDIPDEVIDLMLQVEFRSQKKLDTKEDWMQLFFSIKTLLGE
jgi:transcriptional regulator with XRE-family HTH domain